MSNKITDKLSMFFLGVLALTSAYFIFQWLNGAFKEHKHWVYSVDINDDGLIASASENQILLWNGSYNIGVIDKHSDVIKSISFSNDNSLIVSGGIDKKVKIWSLPENKVLKELEKHSKGVNSVQFCLKDKYVVSAGYDHKLFIWDWKKKSVIKELDVKNTEFSISPQNILAYSDTLCNINLLDLNSLSVKTLIKNFCGSIVFSQKGELIAIRDHDGLIYIVNSISGENLAQLDMKHKSHYDDFEFTPDEKNIVAGIWGGDIEIWDWRNNQLIKELNGTFGTSVEDFSFDRDGKLLTASGDRSIKIWNIENGHLESNLGDGLYKKQLLGILSLLIVIVLSVSFIGVYQDNKSKYSNWGIKFILTLWTIGILLIILPFKDYLSKTSIKITWVFTILSGLFVLSLYGSWLAIFTIPISLSMGYIKLKTAPRNQEAFIPVILNLILVGIISSFVVSAGLWR